MNIEWFCDVCKCKISIPEKNTIVDEDGKEYSYNICPNCDGMHVFKIEYETKEELYKKLKLFFS